MGVGVGTNADGNETVLIGTSELRGYLRPGVTLEPGETMVSGTGHAEADIINYAKNNGISLPSIGATRPVCPACQLVISPETVIATPTK
jgi:filamentous hemagglutinin